MEPKSPAESARRIASTVLAVVAALAGCAARQDTGPADPPPEPPAAAVAASRLPQAKLPDGTVLTLELAITPDEIARGLKFRPSLPEDRGMLFLFEVERVPHFWMKDTLIPLDLLFLDAGGMVVDLIADAQPCRIDPCPNYIPTAAARAVLELNAGSARQHGIEVGDRLGFARVEGYPSDAAGRNPVEE